MGENMTNEQKCIAALAWLERTEEHLRENGIWSWNVERSFDRARRAIHRAELGGNDHTAAASGMLGDAETFERIGRDTDAYRIRVASEGMDMYVRQCEILQDQLEEAWDG